MLMIHARMGSFIAAAALAAGALAAAGAEAAAPAAQADVPLFVNEGQFKYRLPSLWVTREGTVLAACQKRAGPGDDFAVSSLVLRRSRDGGRTFEPEQTLFERKGFCTFNGNLVEERRGGTIFATFIAFPQADGPAWFTKTWIPSGGGFSIIRSADDGKTWSEPIDIVPKPNADGWPGGGAFNNNHGVQLAQGPHAGRLIIGARVFKKGAYEGRAKAGLILSDDQGRTWRVGGVVLKDLGDVAGEVTVGITPGGEVYVNSRNAVGKAAAGAVRIGPPAESQLKLVPHQRIYSRSRDGGESFYEEGFHADLHDEPCNAGQALFSPAGGGGSLMLFTAPAGPRRSHLTGYVSRDGGRSWKAGNVISERFGGYSDIAVLPDRTILVLYEGDKGLLLARCGIEWLTAKEAFKP